MTTSEPTSDDAATSSGPGPDDVSAPGAPTSDLAAASGPDGMAASGPAETGSATPLQVALGRLDGIHQRPTHEQADLYQSVHTELQNALGTIDDA